LFDHKEIQVRFFSDFPDGTVCPGTFGEFVRKSSVCSNNSSLNLVCFVEDKGQKLLPSSCLELGTIIPFSRFLLKPAYLFDALLITDYKSPAKVFTEWFIDHLLSIFW